MFKHPFWLAAGAGVLVLLAAAALPLLHLGGGGGRPAAVFEGAAGGSAAGASGGAVAGAGAGAGAGVGAGADASTQAGGVSRGQGLPWQVERLADGGSRVMGLRPGQDTLADAQRQLGDALQVALVARIDEVGTLEALVDPYSAGFVSGRLVLAFDAPAPARQRWRAAATDSQPMEGGARRFALPAEALAQAAATRLVGLSLVPTLRLSEADVQQRFGAPAERLLAAPAVHLLYPALGLAVSVQPGARPVLQYVAPAEFEARLRAPLRAAGVAQAASSGP